MNKFYCAKCEVKTTFVCNYSLRTLLQDLHNIQLFLHTHNVDLK